MRVADFRASQGTRPQTYPKVIPLLSSLTEGIGLISSESYQDDSCSNYFAATKKGSGGQAFFH